ncbi:hypothetical protein JCM10207_000947 [Rhodosporidiobolus poonsookiae]
MVDVVKSSAAATTASGELAFSSLSSSTGAPIKPGSGGTSVDDESKEQHSKASSIASVNTGDELLIIPWRYKGPVLALVIFFEMAVYWTSGMGSIKSTIVKDLGITNAKFGVISSASSLINTIVPFVSGAALDYYGAEICALLCTVLVLVGYLIAAVGAQTGSYSALVVGSVLSGFGDITVRTAQLKISAHWFQGTHLGLALGLAIAVQRTIGVVAKATAVPIAEKSGWAWFFWTAFILEAFVLLLCIAYYMFERRVPEQYRAPCGRRSARKQSGGEKVRFKGSLRTFWKGVWALPAFFWVLLLTQMMQNGVVIQFQTLSADMIRVIRGTTEKKAGWVAAVGQVPVIILTPLTGIFFDKIGFRVHFIALSAIGWIIIFCLLAYTRLNAIGITMLQSLPYAINLIPLQAVIALTVGPHQQGSAQGAYQALVNAGTVIVGVAAGAIQDGSPKGKHNYDRVLIFLLAIKAWDVVAGSLYCFLDWTSLDLVLTRSNRQQRVYREKVVAGEVVPPSTPMLKPKRTWTTVALTVMLAQCIAAWVVYLKYSV